MAGASEAGESDFRDEKLVQECEEGESSTDPHFTWRPWDKAERSGEDTLILRTPSPQPCGHCIFHSQEGRWFLSTVKHQENIKI